MKVAIIKYNAGNIRSVMIALERLGISAELTDNPEQIKAADKIIFPGVGEASTAMKSLLNSGLDQLIPNLKQPFLGTCVGMQLLCNYSEENHTKCIGVFDIDVIRFKPKLNEKIPQTGWNDIYNLNTEICKGISENAYVYYNHSFYAPLCKYTVAETDYIQPYSAILQKDNFYACQFHSEISGNVGEQILKNFLDL